MRKPRWGYSLLYAGVLLAGMATVHAADLPPPGHKALSTLLQSVESQAAGRIQSVEFDDGYWEIKACKAGDCVKYYLDPMTGAQRGHKPDHTHDPAPPASGRPLSSIVQSLEQSHAGVVTEAEYEHGRWEIQLREHGRKSRVYVDPRTGKVVR